MLFDNGYSMYTTLDYYKFSFVCTDACAAGTHTHVIGVLHVVCAFTQYVCAKQGREIGRVCLYVCLIN